MEDSIDKENDTPESFLKQSAKDDPALAEALSYLFGDKKELHLSNVRVDLGPEIPPAPKPKRGKRSDGDEPFRFTGYIPLERRKSSRISKKKPEFDGKEIDDMVEGVGRVHKRRRYSDDDDDDDDLSYLTKKSKSDSIYPVWKEFLTRNEKKGSRQSFKSQSRPPIIAVEDVTEEMLANISKRVKDKVYDSNGTSCHQCRQKTRDQKTSCRNPECIGVQGQFCGVCIKNRYGEEAADALKDPNWTCFVCRGICNCSFCRRKMGKVPTGILVPIAQRMGHNNVNDFLSSLEGKYDRIHWPSSDEETEEFLGFADTQNNCNFCPK